MPHQTTTEETPGEVSSVIAPDEVKLLLNRLTEYSVEARKVGEPRTLAALAAETGIPLDRLQRELSILRRPRRASPGLHLTAIIAIVVAGLGLSYYIASRPDPTLLSVPAAQQSATPETMTPIDRSGLATPDQATFGPDYANALVDSAYKPLTPPPKGLSIALQAEGILWGAGDHRAAAIHRTLRPEEEHQLLSSILELSKYVRNEAIRRKLPVQIIPGTATRGYSMSFSISTYLGNYIEQMAIPLQTDGNDPLQEAVKNTSEKVISQMNAQMKSLNGD